MEKTPRMRMLEERFGKPIEDVLKRLYWTEKLSLAQVARKLGSVSGAWPKPSNKTASSIAPRSAGGCKP